MALIDELFAAVKAGNEKEFNRLIEERLRVEVKPHAIKYFLLTEENGTTLHTLLKLGADVNFPNYCSKTPIAYAKSLDIVNLLLANGANPHSTDGYGSTALFHVPSLEIARLLIREKKVKADAFDVHRKTALFYAQSPEIAALLIANGAKAYHTDLIGRTPFFYVKSLEMVKWFVENGGI